MAKIKVHSSHHGYDVNALMTELNTLKKVRVELLTTQVPEYMHIMISEEIKRVELDLSRGYDPRLM